MTGCPFGDGCHFLHHVPGGYNAVLQMNNYSVPAQHHMAPQAAPSGRFQAGHGGPNSPAVKSKLCSRYITHVLLAKQVRVKIILIRYPIGLNSYNL